MKNIKKMIVLIVIIMFFISSCNLPTESENSSSTESESNYVEPSPTQQLVPIGQDSEGKCWQIPMTISDTPSRTEYCTLDPFTGYEVSGKYYLDNDLDGKGSGDELFFCCPTLTSDPILKFAQMQFVYDEDFDCDDTNREVYTIEQCEEAKKKKVLPMPSGSSSFENYGCGPINTPWRENQVPETTITFENEGISNKIEIHPDIEPILKELIKRSKEKGYTVHALQGYRSYTEQGDLYIKNKKEKKPTGKSGFSQHQTGYAVDLYLNDPTKSLDSWHWLDLPPEVVKITDELGIVHPWPSPDPPHFCIPANVASSFNA
jgi:hypothetical protein